MCGIVGFVDNNSPKKEIIKKMADKIAHRGPDGEGYYIDNVIALGHRRLAIIDIKGGKQPLASDDYVLIFNGEIYNYQELRTILKKDGYIFKTNSDTEVILQGFKKWQKELPKKLRGMFSFAIWDKKNKTLFCGRDHFGMKPFYYYQNNEVFMFASEIKAFLEHPKFIKEFNHEVLDAYLAFSFNPNKETFFKNVYSIDPGCILIYKDNKIMIEKYFEPTFEIKENTNYIKDIRKVLNNSVKKHLISDAEIGLFLSSGIDSSYLASLSKVSKTYTVGYENKKYNEISYATNFANELNINNYQKVITKKEYMASINTALYYLDEPLYDPAAVSLYHLSALAKKDVKVLIGGEGADEFFAGYNTYKFCALTKNYNKIPFGIRKIISLIFKALPPHKGRNFLVRSGEKIEDNYVGVNKIFEVKEIKKVLNYKPKINIKKIINPYVRSKKENITKMQAIDLNLWLVKDILEKADKMGMANSIEIRCPFVDKEVFKVASSLPEKYKISKSQTKIALRKSASNLIPEKTLNKEKLGFPVPIREWLYDYDVYSEIKNTFINDYAKKFFNIAYLLKLLEQHKSHKKDNYKKIWIIYTFLKWYEIYFKD